MDKEITVPVPEERVAEFFSMYGAWLASDNATGSSDGVPGVDGDANRRVRRDVMNLTSALSRLILLVMALLLAPGPAAAQRVVCPPARYSISSLPLVAGPNGRAARFRASRTRVERTR